ncbi:glycosyltransferase family 2 protein [Microbacterium xanthum]|uniref:glycosyltransferase family 2 protein n=1 Tax=Microbacterium xanthum TaxID=3079794 RepID=UPI002AD4AC62|nr:glycosyltransferase family A protein [Microbacterium sp. KSW-48]MDZ8171047.1 glycosyltransferase family A protein [Microbacterium sp. KSW-48]
MPRKVAIVVRTKDRPHFLSRALESISRQQMPDWECVIVNDGGAKDAVERLVEDLPVDVRGRVSVIHHPQPRGRWVSANVGVLATSSPLLVLHDDDDSWHPEFLSTAVAYLEEHPAREGVVSRTEIRWEEMEGNDFRTVERELFQPQLTAPTLSDTLLFNRFVPIAFVYRRSLHAEIGLYTESLPVVGDWDFNLKVLARGPLDYMDTRPLAYWHQRRGVAGPGGNSVIDAESSHRHYDAQIRDAALRDYVSENGNGLVLYLTKFIDTRLVEVEEGIRRAVIDASTITRIRRRLRRRRA